MSTTQFGRALRLTIDTVQILMQDVTDDVLACSFKVTKNLKAEPNKVEVSVWNLARATRKLLETPKSLTVKIEAGYGSVSQGTLSLHTLYLGTLRSAQTERDGADIKTSIASGDNEGAFGFGRSMVTVPSKATPAAILNFAAQGLQAAGVGLGNLQQAPATGTFGGVSRVLHGNAAKNFDDVCRMNALEWSIQDGNLQVLPIGSSLATTAVSLSSDTGLIGVPSVDTKGILKCKAEIQPGLMPGCLVVMAAEFIQGAYRIEEVTFSGETWGDAWEAEITGRKWQ